MVAISKKFGQLKQWTGEKFGAVEKTNVSEEFKRLDLETESRKEGVDCLTISFTDYAKTLDKRSSQNKKMSVLMMVSKSMMQQGNFHGENQDLGHALLKISTAEDRIALLQEELAEKLRKGLLMDLMSLSSSMENYASLKKKMESRRLDYDAKLNKLNKSKKEKPGLEEEMKNAQKKYNETLNDVESLMSTFAEREEVLLGPLMDFIHAQNAFYHESASILQGLIDDLGSTRQKPEAPQKRSDSINRKNMKTILPPVLLENNRNDLSEEGANTKGLKPSPVLQEVPSAPKVAPNAARSQSIRGSRTKSEEGTASSLSQPPPLSSSSSTSNILLVKYDFDAQMPCEMSIRAGQRVELLEKTDEGWWKGKVNGKIGLFPANYVVPLEECSEAKLSSNNACNTCGCQDFVANVFKPKNCNNCFHGHVD